MLTRRLLPVVTVSLAVGVWGGGPASAGATIGPPIAIADGGAPALSYNGRYLAYETFTAGAGRVLRKDLSTGTVTIVNRSLSGAVAGGSYSLPPLISGNGQRVAFTSSGSTLVSGDRNGKADAFVRDVPSSTTLLADVALGGGPSAAGAGYVSLSRNGRFAVFTSQGTDLVPGSTTVNNDVYLRDLSTGSTRQVSVKRDGTPSRGPGSTVADVSADGTLVVFNSYDRDLVAGDADAESDLFVRNMATGVTRLLTPSLPAGANPDGVVMSPDGRWVTSRWANGSLHLTNVATATTTQIVADGFAVHGAFSSNGRLFVYTSDDKAYLHDTSTGTDTELNTPAGGSAGIATIAGDGSVAAYEWTVDGTSSTIYRVTLA